MKKVLVTGVSGYIGHQCAVELLKNGYFVKGSLRDLNKKYEVLDGIKKEIDPSNLLGSIINPLSGYFICNHFIGDELTSTVISLEVGLSFTPRTLI